MGIFLFSFLGILAGAILALLVVNFKIDISTVPGHRRFVCIKIFFGGLLCYKTILFLRISHDMHLQIIQVKKRGYKKIATLQMPKINKKRANYLRLLKASEIKKAKLLVELGTDDAAQTALLAGGVNMALHTAFAVLSLPMAEIAVYPNYKKITFGIDIFCIIKLRIANVIGRYIRERRRIKCMQLKTY